MKYLTSIFFVFIVNFTYAQKLSQIDDLEKQLVHSSKEDSIIILNKLADIYIPTFRTLVDCFQ